MVDNFFSTIGGPQHNNDSDSDDGNQKANLASLASGPAFVKSTATTLFQEEKDIESSRGKRAKVTFAKPKAKPSQAPAASKTQK